MDMGYTGGSAALVLLCVVRGLNAMVATHVTIVMMIGRVRCEEDREEREWNGICVPACISPHA